MLAAVCGGMRTSRGVGHPYGVTACVTMGNPFLLTEGYGMSCEDLRTKGSPVCSDGSSL